MGDLHPIIWRPESSKKSDLLWVRETLSYLVTFKLEHRVFSFLFKLKHKIFMPWVCSLQIRMPSLILFTLAPETWTGAAHQPSWVCTLPIHFLDLATCSLFHEPIPLNKSLYICPIGFFLWRTPTNTPCFILSLDILTIYSVLLTVFLSLENQGLSSCLCRGKNPIFRKGKISSDYNTLWNL